MACRNDSLLAIDLTLPSSLPHPLTLSLWWSLLSVSLVFCVSLCLCLFVSVCLSLSLSEKLLLVNIEEQYVQSYDRSRHLPTSRCSETGKTFHQNWKKLGPENWIPTHTLLTWVCVRNNSAVRHHTVLWKNEILCWPIVLSIKVSSIQKNLKNH